MEIEFDPGTEEANRKKYGVSISHAEQTLRNPRAVTIKDPDAEGEPGFVTLGRGALRRILVVVYSRNAERVKLISAREATPNEVAQYHA